ncbi:hypothetical protein EDC94DRAFT_657265 [Helicostylum pulchrum]|nr:hypothetical protein EDC94DRAFT_657265 [Helicostylum pulchrum]
MARLSNRKKSMIQILRKARGVAEIINVDSEDLTVVDVQPVDTVEETTVQSVNSILKDDEISRKKAKEHLEKSGLLAVHIRNHDPFQPMTIGINVHERDSFKSISYPDSPTMPSTDLPERNCHR